MKKTMKRYFIFIASAVLSLAASCVKEEVSTPAGTEVITVELNPVTKTALGENGATTWSEGDAVDVIVGGASVGTLNLVEGNTFSGELTTEGLTGDATLHYPAGVNAVPTEQKAVAGSFYNKTALLEGTTTLDALRKGQGATLSNITALLKFSVAQAGDVVFTVGETTYTVTGCEAGENAYYACVAPVAEAALSYTIAGVEGANSKSGVTFKAGEIYNLGTLNVVVVSNYGLVGSFQGWDVANPGEMFEYGDGWAVAKNVELYKTDEFKFVKGNTWDGSYGTSSVTTLKNNEETKVVTSDSQNMKVSTNGRFNLYLHPTNELVKVDCVEEYTDLKVNITINNKANWSPLYITLKDGETVVANNATVTNNVYTVSGDYIGSSLTCVLSNGSKTFETTVSITKEGANVTLEETIIKLMVQLNTDNSKTWWGNTMKIHVWDTGTSLDTVWDGVAMASEGNYTWSIIVPSELVGKTIKYLVHNGNGWQSSDSTVMINAEGNTVTGSSIGIN